nr:MAG TPA: hypothetical protein [Caudoviricetes sp.]
MDVDPRCIGLFFGCSWSNHIFYVSNVYFWHIADQRHWRKAMEDRWEEVKILSCKKYAKSITVGNHSILALSEVHQPAAARSCIRRACGFIYLRPETSYTVSIHQHHR